MQFYGYSCHMHSVKYAGKKYAMKTARANHVRPHYLHQVQDGGV
jgi:hypothetical protein